MSNVLLQEGGGIMDKSRAISGKFGRLGGKIKGTKMAKNLGSPISYGFTLVFRLTKTILTIFSMIFVIIFVPSIPIFIYLIVIYFIVKAEFIKLRTL